MANVTWGVKVPDDLKAKIDELKEESGLSGEDFVNSLLQAYELKIIKDEQPVMKADIEELQVLTGRIVSIFSNLGARVENLAREKDDQYMVQIQGKDGTIQIYYNKVKELEQSLEKLTSERTVLEGLYSDIQKRNIELEESCETNKALSQEYRDKNDYLNGQLRKYEAYVTENENLKAELQQEIKNRKDIEESNQVECRNAEVKLSDALKNIEVLEKQIHELIQKTHADKETADAKLMEEIELVKEKAYLEKERAILELKVANQESINELHKQYNDKIRDILFEGKLPNDNSSSKAKKNPETKV